MKQMTDRSALHQPMKWVGERFYRGGNSIDREAVESETVILSNKNALLNKAARK